MKPIYMPMALRVWFRAHYGAAAAIARLLHIGESTLHSWIQGINRMEIWQVTRIHAAIDLPGLLPSLDNGHGREGE
jgi:hypothetical protein